MGKELEFRTIGKEQIADFIRQLDEMAEAMANPETKYKFQVKLKEVEFDVDREKADALGVTLPVGSIDEAERLLQEGVISPKRFVEQDETVHEIIEFQPEPVGYSGFDNCVVHSLAQTDRGLFELGRYPAMDLETQTKTWQWLIHRKIRQRKDQWGMTSGLERYTIQPEDVLTDREYQVWQRAQAGELPCPQYLDIPLSAKIIFDEDEEGQIEGLLLYCSKCGFREY